jgi:hypothetical protein
LAPSTFTLALVVKTTAPGTFVRNPLGGAFVSPREPSFSNEWATGRIVNDEIPQPLTTNYESVSKIGSQRYGNREFLEELRLAGRIEDTTIAGWSLLYKHAFDPETSYPVSTLVARKGDQEVDLSDVLTSSYPGGVYSGNYIGRGTYQYDGQGNITSFAYSATGGGVYEDIAELVFTNPSSAEVYRAGGFSSGRYSYFSWQELPGEYNELTVPGVQRITGLLGLLVVEPDPDAPEEEQSYSPVILTGSATLGPSRAVKQ